MEIRLDRPKTLHCTALLIFVIGFLFATIKADARIQEDFLCWGPDIEFPVPCDDEDD